MTPDFPAIDSYDVAPKEGEVVFSAKREKGFDVGIVAATGGEVNWVPSDPGDERHVTWAPRGSKVAYAIESADATYIRSVHVPTSFQLTFDLPLTVVHAIAWEPRAERIAMVIESPTSSASVDWAEYNGEKRATLVPPSRTLATSTDRIAWVGGSATVLPPSPVRYGERLPLVVSLSSGRAIGWSDTPISIAMPAAASRSLAPIRGTMARRSR